MPTEEPIDVDAFEEPKRHISRPRPATWMQAGLTQTSESISIPLRLSSKQNARHLGPNPIQTGKRYRPQDDVYPNKRSAHSATPTLNVIHNVKPLPVHIEIIDLVDDDLESTMLLPTQPTLQCSRDEPSTTLPVPPSHLSTSPPGSAHDSPDESDEYSFIHQGFDASSSIWLKSQFSSVPDTSSVFDRLTSSAEGSLRHALDQIMEPELGFSRATYLRAFQREHLVWPMMKHARCPPVRWRRLYSGQQFNRHQTSCNIGRKLGLIGLQYDPMPEFHAAGDITSIVQSADVVVVASATPGGSNEVADDPYNQSGTLLCYHNATKKVEFKNAHFASHESDQEAGPEYFFSVGDVKFDPCRADHFISSGCDGTVRTWVVNATGNCAEDLDARISYKKSQMPGDIEFRNQTSLFSVANRDGCLYVYGNGITVAYQVAPKHSQDQSVGKSVWGAGASDGLLCVSTEQQNVDMPVFGHHKIFDVESQMTITSFPDVSESGDSMALNTHGSQLALMTMTEGHKHMLRMYDLARLDERALFVMELKPFPEGSGDVTAASFSPDDIFIALGRSDDTVEVWDTRYMGPGVKPIFEFSHGPKKRSCPDSFGIASSMQWVQEQRTLGFGLVSGGDDGCVRLWDVRKACLGPQDAEVLAEVDLEVAAFSLGKIGSVGPELVVGDAGGHVHVYEWKREWDE